MKIRTNGRTRLMVVMVTTTLLATAFASAPVLTFTGHYELADTKAEQSFSLDVTQTGTKKADISFSAAMADGSGAAPDGDGKGELKGGTLTFTFKDSFDNEGTGTFVKTKDGYHLKLDATKVTEPRCLRFYGDVLLRKTADKPQ